MSARRREFDAEKAKDDLATFRCPHGDDVSASILQVDCGDCIQTALIEAHAAGRADALREALADLEHGGPCQVMCARCEDMAAIAALLRGKA